MSNGTGRLSWGVKLQGSSLTEAPDTIEQMLMPDTLVVSLNQNIGVPALPSVEPGQRVLKGQPISTAPRWSLSVAVHAPTSGIVTAIEDRAVARAGGGVSCCVVIEPDGADEAYSGYAIRHDPLRMPPAEIRHDIMEAGIVGLGGALFPTATKLNPGIGIRALILNGVECDPYISCDKALLKAHSDQVLSGASIMLRALDTDECIVAVKADMTDAQKAVQDAIDALGDDRITLATVPARYPAGGERQLIQTLTGLEVPAGGLPWDVGVVCQNVATAAAVARFFEIGEPLISRIITVAGGGVRQPKNIETRIGTLIKDMVEFAGGYTESASRLVMGGPMMGISLPHDKLGVTKATNCILVAGADEIDPTVREMPCIRCGECSQACPAQLMPQQLIALARGSDFGELDAQGLQDCIECGCCDYVCPSYIPLTSRFIEAKERLWQYAQNTRRSERAMQRFELREQRLADDEVQRRQELDHQVAELDSPGEVGEDALRELQRRTGSKDKDKA